MNYEVLWIVSMFLTAIYLTFGGLVFFKYRSLLDPFIKSNIIIFSTAFVTKTIFWFVSWSLDSYNSSVLHKPIDPFNRNNIVPLVPIRATLGSIVSAISFLILQIIIFRIILAYYLLKLEGHSDLERNLKVRKIERLMYSHIAFYSLIVFTKVYVDY